MINITIGRDSSNRIMIEDPGQTVSSFHAELKIKEDGSLFLQDKSTNGTYVNGVKIPKFQDFPVFRGNEILFAKTVRLDWSLVPNIMASTDTEKLYSIGRNNDNDILYQQDAMSRYHATIRVTKTGKYFLFDTSTNGTYINGSRIPTKVEVEIKPTDRVNFANVQELDWKKVEKGNPAKTVSITDFTRFNKKTWPAAIVLLLALSVFLFFKLRHQDLYEKYNDAIVLVYQEYVDKVTLDNLGTFYYGLTQFSDGTIGNTFFSDYTSQAETGTGFFISTDGAIVTNRHVAAPWEEDKKSIIADAPIFVESLANTAAKKYKAAGSRGDQREMGYWSKVYDACQHFNKGNISIEGRPVFLGVAMNNTHVNRKNNSDYISCTMLRYAQDERVDLGLLQTNNKKLPDKVHDIVDAKNILSTEELKPGIKVFLIGYPKGFTMADTQLGLKSNFQTGQISRESDNYNFGHSIPSTHGASGSPVFNEDGKLVGVNYAGFDGTQGYNLAITASQLKKFLNQ